MDLIKTLLVYMMMVVSAATEAAPALTPPPADSLPSAAPYVTPSLAPTAVPTLAPTAPPVPYTTLYVGDRGDEVKKLQRRLTELGYLDDTIDGIYGQNTKKAVERFQYYNNLKVDGIAGKATQATLYESTAVVTAPPNITRGPALTPTATVPVSVSVPIYYINEDGQLLRRVDMTCYGTTTIYANGNYVGPDYVLTSSSSVTVSVQNGRAVPASVTFRYQKRSTPAPTEPAMVIVPVYYTTEDGAMLHQTSASLYRGSTSYVNASLFVIPADYQLIGSSSVAVTVTAQGAATPSTVIFRCQYIGATAAPATEVPATEIPATEVPATEVPATEVPATEVPATEVPATEVPATEVPATEVPATEVPATEVPATEVPATEVPATEVPATEVPATEVPATEVPATEVPATEVPATEVPATEVPATEVPATEVPATEVPATEVPATEVPATEIPATPVPSGLTAGGGTLRLNGTALAFTWYLDEAQRPMLSLKALARAAEWDYAPGSACTVLGHSLLAAYDDGGISALTIDGQSHSGNGRVWEGDLYVNFAFLQALGMDTSLSGDTLSISFPE